MFISTAFSHSLPRPSMQTKCVVSMRTFSAIFPPIRSIAPLRLSRSGGAIMPGVTVMPDRSVILCVRTVNLSLLYSPALVLKTNWKLYSVSTARPLILVLVISLGLGMLPALLPFLYKLRLRSSAVARAIGSHSRTIEVCVALRQRMTGGLGDCWP